MSRVKLSSIPAITFYQGSKTESRRNSPISQLTCRGNPCRLYNPDVVRCTNIGGRGTEVDWKCEADLPETLRLGRVEVSCEGWSGPGDSYVLKGSCALEYRLVEIPSALRNPDSHILPPKAWDLLSTIFTIVWVTFLLVILYSFIKSCMGSNAASRNPRPHTPAPGGSGWFPGFFDDNSDPSPPPYSKEAPGTQGQAWRPGFWTGAALGGLGAHWLNNRGQNDDGSTARRTPWDWERRSAYRAPEPVRGRPPSDDRGEGSSNLGGMRRSTGFGGSSVR